LSLCCPPLSVTTALLIPSLSLSLTPFLSYSLSPSLSSRSLILYTSRPLLTPRSPPPRRRLTSRAVCDLALDIPSSDEPITPSLSPLLLLLPGNASLETITIRDGGESHSGL